MRAVTLLALIATGVEAIKYRPYENKPPPMDAYKKYDTSLDMTINPSYMDGGTAGLWCESGSMTCRHLCGGETLVNDCNHRDLQNECICQHNLSRPGLEYYTKTVPTFICHALYWTCHDSFEVDWLYELIRNEADVAQKKAKSAEGRRACKENILAKCGTIPRERADVDYWLDKSYLEHGDA